jgi:argininosuccinate synthase
MNITKDALRFKDTVSAQYADLIYNGLWFSAFHQDLVAYVLSSQRLVKGTVRVRLSKGACTVVGRKSPFSLYSESLATYQKEDTFDHNASLGFIKIYGLPVKIQSQKQMDVLSGKESLHLDRIIPPRVKSLETPKKTK